MKPGKHKCTKVKNNQKQVELKGIFKIRHLLGTKQTDMIKIRNYY